MHTFGVSAVPQPFSFKAIQSLALSVRVIVLCVKAILTVTDSLEQIHKENAG
jgi:hypothetical protein